METGIIFLIAVGLSMDAFSLALIYGTLNLEKNIQYLLSGIVGIFHFFMPMLGFFLGRLILQFLPIRPEILVGIIFIFIALQMIFSLFKEEKVEHLSSVGALLLFGFTVSIDSFSVGIGMSGIQNHVYYECIIFSLTSGLFTFFGLKLGTTLALKFGKLATFFGSLVLFALGIHYFL